MKSNKPNILTLTGLPSFLFSVSIGATLRDKMSILLFIVLPKLVLFPFYFLDTKLWFSLMRYIYDFTPEISLNTSFGKFECRKHSLDFSHLNLFYEKNLMPLFNVTNGVFIDVGAHVGRYTVMVGRKIKKGKVIAIEPEPSNFVALQKNISLNGLEKKTISLNVAASDKKGRIKLYLEDFKGGGAHSTIKNWEAGKDYIEVACMRLDELLKSLKLKPLDIKLIKIDVEGAEFDVLKGAKEILRHHPQIVFESANKSSLNKCLRMLYRYGYKVNQVDEVNFFAYQ